MSQPKLDKSVEKQKFDMFITYQKVFESEDGQKVLKDMMDSCFFMHSTLSESPYETHYKEGQRSFLLRIIQTLKVDPSQMLKLLDLDNQQGEHNALD